VRGLEVGVVNVVKRGEKVFGCGEVATRRDEVDGVKTAEVASVDGPIEAADGDGGAAIAAGDLGIAIGKRSDPARAEVDGTALGEAEGSALLSGGHVEDDVIGLDWAEAS